MDLSGKTILFLAPKFFGYELEIKKELEGFGAKVIYFDERPKNDFLTKVFIRLNLKFFISKKIENYYQDIEKQIKNINLEYVFLLNVETTTLHFIKNIKNNNSNSKILIYFWDSVNNRKQSLEYLKFSDSFFSFDSNDINLNNRIKFLPLFYIRDYENIGNLENEPVYDMSFIGTVHSDRYRIIKKIEKQAEYLNLRTHFYFYSPSKILFFLQKLFKKDFKPIKWKDISFKSMSKLDVITIIEKSKVIIDIQHPMQKGLTMRTIEVLGAKKKLFTTNDDIKKYDFYNKNNVHIINRNEPKLDFNFLKENYQNLNKDIYEKYSLKNWLKIIFKEHNA